MKSRRKLRAIIPVAIFSLISIVVLNCSSQDLFDNLLPHINKSRDLYKEALQYQNSNDFKSAYYAYDKIPSSYLAYDIVLYQQSKCAAGLEDEKTAIDKLETLVSKYKNSPIAPQASYSLGQAYVRTKDYEKAEKQFLKTAKRYPETDFAIGSYYYLGQLNKDKDPGIAAGYWLKYIELSPDGRFSLDCLNGIKSIKPVLTVEDKKNVAIALFKNRRYSEANGYLKQIPVKDSWYYLAKANIHLGNSKTAIYILKEGISKYSNSATKAQIHDAMSGYVRISAQPAADSWTELSSISKEYGDFALFQKAKSTPKDQSLAIYRTIADNYPSGDFAPESLWNLFWYEFNKGNYDEAINLGKRHIEKYTNTRSSPKIAFWTAKAYERIRQDSHAVSYYNKVLSLYPDSYYAFRADGRVKAINSGNDPGWSVNKDLSVNEELSGAVLPYTYSKIYREHGEQVAELINLGDYDTALAIMKKDPFLDSWIKLKTGIISKSIVLARDGMFNLMPKPESHDRRWNLIYPVFYPKEINQFARLNNLDPILILSLIKEESYFNPLAVSCSNAQGLMQLLPGTSRDVARWNNYGNISKFQMFDPKTNIMLGTAYFRYAKGRLNNSSLFAVAGYNGGPGAVEKWLKTLPNEDMDQFIENIPYDQTRDYIKKVYGSYWNYKRIYNY